MFVQNVLVQTRFVLLMIYERQQLKVLFFSSYTKSVNMSGFKVCT